MRRRGPAARPGPDVVLRFAARERVFKPRRYEIMIPGPWSHWAKLAFEKHYLSKMKHGMVYLP